MREDMHKVVVERERYNPSARSAKTRLRLSHYDPERHDDLPSRISNGQLYAIHGRDKGFTDVLGPLSRFLEKQVGRPWTKVHGELLKGLDTRKVTGRHVLDHAYHMVQREVFIGVDRRPYSVRGAWPVRFLYVDPRTGILRRAPPPPPRMRRRWFRLSEVEHLRIDPLLEYHKVNGTWYVDQFEECDPRMVLKLRRDAEGELTQVEDRDLHSLPWRRLIRTRQARRGEVAWLQEKLERGLQGPY